MSQIPVYFEEAPVGQIRIGAGDFEFAYDPSWADHPPAFPVSVLAPLHSSGMSAEQFVPWLANLLPEGEPLANVGRALGTSTQDVLGILERIGTDTAGALSFGAPAVRGQPAYRLFGSEETLERIINDLPRRPFLAGEDGVSMSLAGAQYKLPVMMVDDALAIPLNGSPSTHILKPDNDHLPGSVQNEALCLALGHLVGLKTVQARSFRAGARSYLLVQRYDRRLHNDQFERIHQEDFCQALGRPPGAKYEHNRTGIRGPTLAEMFGVTRATMQARDVLSLLDAVIFNVLIANVDSHAKNYSIVHDRDGPQLAPLYDLMAADAWEGITKNMAQDIGGENRGAQIRARHWGRFARECGFNANRVIRRVRDLARRADEMLGAAQSAVTSMPAGGHFMLDLFVETIRARIATVLKNLESDGPHEG